jgi:5-methyltetrahydrofolate--homocysteine methyltransferase
MKVGRCFEARECFAPELLFSSPAMKAAVAVPQPLLKQAQPEPAGAVLIATIQGDLHENLVALLLEGGFRVHDMGVDVTPAKIIDAVKKFSPDIVALSALITVTLPAMKTNQGRPLPRGSA